jgi:hypothetical protein
VEVAPPAKAPIPLNIEKTNAKARTDANIFAFFLILFPPYISHLINV